mgnify:CR=1 FL=1
MVKIRDLKKGLDKQEAHCDFSLHRVSRFIQPSLLLFLSKGASYGYELIDKLKGLGFHKESIDVGAVYRTLRKLEREGFVKSAWVKKDSRRKRVYKITSEGRALLKAWIERVKERKQALEKFIKIYQGGKL